MKPVALFLCLLLYASQNTIAQSVGIGTNSPVASAQLEIQSTSKGLLIPRVTTAQRNAIVAPARSLMVFDSTDNNFWFYNGTAWQTLNVAASSPWSIAGNNIYNSNSGNVGIGTANPATALYISKPSPAISFYDAGKNHYSGLIQADSTDIYINAFRRSTLTSNPAGDLLLQVNGGTLLNPTIAGNVGIGTATPAYKLEVWGDASIENELWVNGNFDADGTVDLGSGMFTLYPPSNAISLSSSTLGLNASTMNVNVPVAAFSDDITVQNGRGIVRSSNSSQMRVHLYSGNIVVNLAANASVTFNIAYTSFSAAPHIAVANIAPGTGSYDKVIYTVHDVDANSAIVTIYNPSAATANINGAFKAIIIGPQ